MKKTAQDQSKFENFLQSLLAKFKNDEKLLDRRCSFIIQTLCAHVDSEKVCLLPTSILNISWKFQENFTVGSRAICLVPGL